MEYHFNRFAWPWRIFSRALIRSTGSTLFTRSRCHAAIWLEEEEKQNTLAELKDKGVDLQQIPQEELEPGEGEAIAALKRWYSYVDSMTARGRSDLVDQLDDLENRIEA